MQGRSSLSAYLPSAASEADPLATEYRPLLLTRNFGLVWSGQLISQIGDGISRLALLWFVYAVTGSPLKTSMIGLLQTIPPIVLGPLIGVYHRVSLVRPRPAPRHRHCGVRTGADCGGTGHCSKNPVNRGQRTPTKHHESRDYPWSGAKRIGHRRLRISGSAVP